MDHGVDRPDRERARQIRRGLDTSPDDDELAGKGRELTPGAIRQVDPVEGHDGTTPGQEMFGDVQSDEAGGTGDEDGHAAWKRMWDGAATGGKDEALPCNDLTEGMVAATAEKTRPALWEAVKARVMAGDKGGRAGQWSARKAQLAVHEYKAEGGGYVGQKTRDNHLEQWTREDWGTKSGQESGETGERYLPKAARDRLSDTEYRRTTEKKRADTRRGKQNSAQPKDVAAKTSAARRETESVAGLRRLAAARGVLGRSRMRKAELLEALR